MKLQALQEDFQRLLLDEPGGVASWVASSRSELNAQQRIAIYHNAYRVRLVAVLADSFAHTATYLGEAWFQRLAERYVQQRPSAHHNIADYGSDFPAFLARELSGDLEVAELAKMDWRLRRAFDGADCEAMSIDDLHRMAAAAAEVGPSIAFVPTASLLHQCHNTLDIWHAIDDERVPPRAAALARPIAVLIWRKGHSPHFRSLWALEAAAVAQVLDGADLEQTGERLARRFPGEDIPQAIGQCLQRWIADGALAKPAQ